jgi:ADP-heptose:LPS heptosyltransferase
LFLLKEPLIHSFFSLWKELYDEKFDTVLLFHASQRLTLPLCALIGAKKIVGTAGINKGLDCLLTHPLPNKAQHEIVRRLKIAEAIGALPATEKLSLFIDETLPPRSKGTWVALHPGSKDAFKRWPKEKFIELGRRLKKELSCEILITGTKEERALMEEIASEIPGAHVDLPNRSLREFAALLNQMDLLISNDTGPVHLASALNKPVVAIYASTDPFLCGPHKAEKAVVISRRPTCDPCLKRKCHLPFCFLQIGVDEVFEAAQSALQKSDNRQKLDAAEKT